MGGNGGRHGGSGEGRGVRGARSSGAGQPNVDNGEKGGGVERGGVCLYGELSGKGEGRRRAVMSSRWMAGPTGGRRKPSSPFWRLVHTLQDAVPPLSRLKLVTS